MTRRRHDPVTLTVTIAISGEQPGSAHAQTRRVVARHVGCDVQCHVDVDLAEFDRPFAAALEFAADDNGVPVDWMLDPVDPVDAPGVMVVDLTDYYDALADDPELAAAVAALDAAGKDPT